MNEAGGEQHQHKQHQQHQQQQHKQHQQHQQQQQQHQQQQQQQQQQQHKLLKEHKGHGQNLAIVILVFFCCAAVSGVILFVIYFGWTALLWAVCAISFVGCIIAFIILCHKKYKHQKEKKYAEDLGNVR